MCFDIYEMKWQKNKQKGDVAMKRRLVAGLMAAMMMMSFAACGGKGGDTPANTGESKGDTQAESDSEGGSKYQTTYGSKQFDDVTIQVELFDRSNAPEGSTITDNRWTKYCQDAMKEVGINLEFVAVPRSDEVTKMQTMMSSGTAPTLTLTYNYTYARDYYKDGGIWDLSEFVDGEDQAQNLKKYIGDNCLSLGRNSDGNLFGIVARRATTAMSDIFIRQDWLDKLGLETPSTVDEYYTAIEKMVKENPEGNSGVIGIVPSGVDSNTTAGYRNVIAMAFMKNVADEEKMAVGEGFEFYADEGYREYMRFLNKCYNNGLMNQEFYAQTTEQMQSYFVNGQLGTFESNVGYNVDILRGSLLQTLKEKNPDAEFIAMPMLKNENNGERYSAVYGEGGLIAFVPKTFSEEQVEAAVTYLDWLSTEEGGFAIYHGIEGEHFEYNEDGVPIAKDADYNQKDKDWIRTDLFLVGNQGYFESVDAFNANIAADNPGYEDYTLQDYELSVGDVAVQSAQYMYAPDSQADTQTDLALLRSEYQTKVITCAEADFDATYDAWLQAAKNAGIEQVLEDRQAVYDEVKGN